ncbi:MAG: proton-conducting transporter membrane subunit, partial [Chlamydiota bacterium]
MHLIQLTQLFYFDFLALCMTGLVLFLGLNIVVFSTRYMQGDTTYRSYFLRLLCLVVSLVFMVSSNHLIVFFLAWLISNFLMSRLMIHKSSWQAASYSGTIALKNFFIGLFFLGTAFVILYLKTGTLSISSICQTTEQTPLIRVSLSLLLLAAMTQSAIWPFHRWLMSSLNSPTPVSAIMHAGIVNGGGFILLRFGTLFANDQMMLQIIFIIGVLTSVVFTTCKLMQHDIKRSLAASTIAQMGFMFAQFGLGLYSVTLAHIILHGLYKSFLFLNSGSSVYQKHYQSTHEASSPTRVLLSSLCAAITLIIFCLTKQQQIFPSNAHLIPQLILTITSFQLAFGLLSQKFKGKELLSASLICSFTGFYYGSLLFFIENVYGLTFGTGAQTLNAIYLSGTAILVISWILFMYGRSLIANFLGQEN